MHYELGDALRSDRIAVEARDIDDVRIRKGSHRHRIQFMKLRGSAYCVIEVPLRTALERKQYREAKSASKRTNCLKVSPSAKPFISP